MNSDQKLLSVKELAAALGKHRNYVHAMRSRGFMMPGGTATLSEARAWQARNPSPRSTRPFVAGSPSAVQNGAVP